MDRREVIALLAGLGLLDANGRPNLSPAGNGQTAASATAGTNGAVPAQVAGYRLETINGVRVKVPYFLP